MDERNGHYETRPAENIAARSRNDGTVRDFHRLFAGGLRDADFRTGCTWRCKRSNQSRRSCALRLLLRLRLLSSVRLLPSVWLLSPVLSSVQLLPCVPLPSVFFLPLPLAAAGPLTVAAVTWARADEVIE